MELALKMSRIRFTEYCLISYALFLTMARGAIVKLPINSATSVGGNCRFDCSSDGSPFQWAFTRDADVFSPNVIAITDGNCNVNSSYSSHFKTERSTNQCNLIITGASLQFAGYYTCSSGSGIGAVTIAHAILVVVDANTNVTSNITEEEIVKDELILSEVKVSFNGPLLSSSPTPVLRPSIKWTLKSDSSEVSSISSETTNTTSSYIIVPATIPTVPSYVCTFSFNPPKDYPPNCDTSTPSYTLTWATPETKTSYMSPPNVSSSNHFEPMELKSCEARFLQCMANAYPPPTIRWIDRKTEKANESSTIMAKANGTYECLTNNTIKGTPMNASTFYTAEHSTFTQTPCEPVSKADITQRSGAEAKQYLNEINLESNTDNLENATEYTLHCTADGVPTPSYFWSGPCLEPFVMLQEVIVVAEGNYTCRANNSINGQVFSATKTIYINGPPENKTVCPTQLAPTTSPPPDIVDEDGLKILLVVLVAIPGIGIILLVCVFFPCYGCSRSRREKINSKFPWIERALPWMNKEGCKCSCEMFFFIFCSVIGGIIFIPFVLIASLCCGKKSSKSSQGDSNSLSLAEGNQSTSENSHENGGQHPKTWNSTGSQISVHPPPPAPYRSPSWGADYPNSQQNSRPSTSNNNRRPKPSTPVGPEGVVYQDLRIDFSPGSRRPVELMDATNYGGEYADLHST